MGLSRGKNSKKTKFKKFKFIKRKMTCDISKPQQTLGEQFLAELCSQSNEKSFNHEDFHAEVRFIKDTVRSMVKPKKKTGHAHLSIVYYNCGHCDNIAGHSCVKKHRHQIETFTKEEFDVLCEVYMQKRKLEENNVSNQKK